MLAHAESVSREAELIMASAQELMDKGDGAAARSQLLKAVEIAPHWMTPAAALGVLHQLEGNEELALEHYTKVQLASLLSEGAQDNRLIRDIAAGEAWMVYLANEERWAQGLKLLPPHPDLAIVARRHSREMRDLGYFSHESPRVHSRRPSDRFSNHFGYRPLCIGENLARMQSTGRWSMNTDNLTESHDRLMNSASHRSTILWELPHYVGIGIAVNERGDFWVTEKFVDMTR